MRSKRQIRRDVTLEARAARHLYILAGFGGVLLLSYAAFLAKAEGVLDSVATQLTEYFHYYSNWYEYVPEIGFAALVLILTCRSRSRRDMTAIAIGALYAIVLLVAFMLIVVRGVHADDGLPMFAVLTAAAAPPAAYLLYCLRDFFLLGVNRGRYGDWRKFCRLARAGNRESGRRHELLKKWIHRPANPEKSYIYLALFSITLSLFVLYLFLSSHAFAYLNYGLGNYARAIKDYDQALKLTPNDAAVLHKRGLARKGIGDDDGAAVDFARAKEIDPKFAD